MRAFLEKNDGEWLDDFVYMSRAPLYNMGVEIIPFDGVNLNGFFEKYSFNKKDILIGSVEATARFFEACGVEVPKYLGYPDSLKDFYNRKIDKTTLSEYGNDYPFFIKPAEDVKMFTGALIESESSLKFLTDYCGLTDNTLLYISEPVKFVSEYRCFVHKGELKGIQHYLGDFTVYPEPIVIKHMIKAYDESPIAYTLDVGVLDTGETTLVEVNDMWAIGSYGFDSKIYVRMCIDRMMEIFNKN